MRFKLIPYVRELVEKSHTYQDYDDIYRSVEIKINKRREFQSRKISYWGLLAVIHNRRLKVIIKKVGNGKAIFWSVIPKWKTKKFGKVIVRSLSSGDLEEE
jgi:hypothetical protein